MNDINLLEPAGVLVKTTCVDYPGIVAGSFFLTGCNLRCPYCYNTELVVPGSNSNFNSLQDLFDHLEKRKNVLKGLVISGGEPLLNPKTPYIIKKAKEIGYKVKVDTNGTFPEKLYQLIKTPETKPDFIAMDIKTSPERYSELISLNSSLPVSETFFSKIKESINLISEYSYEAREWRTVLVPGLITKDEIKKIASLLPEDASWQFAQFNNKNCLNKKYSELIPYTDAEITELINFAKTLIPGASLR